MFYQLLSLQCMFVILTSVTIVTINCSGLNCDTKQCGQRVVNHSQKYIYICIIIYIKHVHPCPPLYYIELMRGIPWLTVMHY